MKAQFLRHLTCRQKAFGVYSSSSDSFEFLIFEFLIDGAPYPSDKTQTYDDENWVAKPKVRFPAHEKFGLVQSICPAQSQQPTNQEKAQY
jgi:hypothetical protein